MKDPAGTECRRACALQLGGVAGVGVGARASLVALRQFDDDRRRVRIVDERARTHARTLLAVASVIIASSSSSLAPSNDWRARRVCSASAARTAISLNVNTDEERAKRVKVERERESRAHCTTHSVASARVPDARRTVSLSLLRSLRSAPPNLETR